MKNIKKLILALLHTILDALERMFVMADTCHVCGGMGKIDTFKCIVCHGTGKVGQWGGTPIPEEIMDGKVKDKKDIENLAKSEDPLGGAMKDTPPEQIKINPEAINKPSNPQQLDSGKVIPFQVQTSNQRKTTNTFDSKILMKIMLELMKKITGETNRKVLIEVFEKYGVGGDE